MGVSYRCTRDHCRRRYRLPKALENYERIPRKRLGLGPHGTCGSCGGHLADVSASTKRWNARFEICHCGAIPFPHRRGTSCWLSTGAFGWRMHCEAYEVSERDSTVVLSEAHAFALKCIAEETGMTVEQVVEEAVDRYLAKTDEEPAL